MTGLNIAAVARRTGIGADTLRKWEKSYGNVVIVREYLGGEGDDELRLLLQYFQELRQVQNVRAVDKSRWRPMAADTIKHE